jgi:hypothetical protein
MMQNGDLELNSPTPTTRSHPREKRRGGGREKHHPLNNLTAKLSTWGRFGGCPASPNQRFDHETQPLGPMRDRFQAPSGRRGTRPPLNHRFSGRHTQHLGPIRSMFQNCFLEPPTEKKNTRPSRIQRFGNCTQNLGRFGINFGELNSLKDLVSP